MRLIENHRDLFLQALGPAGLDAPVSESGRAQVAPTGGLDVVEEESPRPRSLGSRMNSWSHLLGSGNRSHSFQVKAAVVIYLKHFFSSFFSSAVLVSKPCGIRFPRTLLRYHRRRPLFWWLRMHSFYEVQVLNAYVLLLVVTYNCKT